MQTASDGKMQKQGKDDVRGRCRYLVKYTYCNVYEMFELELKSAQHR